MHNQQFISDFFVPLCQRPTKGDELDDFRAKWKKELESAPVSRNATAPTTPVKEFPESREENEEEKVSFIMNHICIVIAEHKITC